MSDYNGNCMDMSSDWAPLSSPSIGEMLDQNEIGLNLIRETFPQTNLSTDPQSEQRSGGLRDILAARRGFNIPPLKIERVSPFANSFRNPILVPPPILEISPGFSSLSPFLQSPNMFSNSSSQIIPNDGPPEAVESSGGAHATMMISNNNIPDQPMDVDLAPQGGSDDIPMEETSVYITPHESNANPIGAPLVPFIDSEVVAETDVMNLVSLESGSDDKDKEYNQEEDEDKNIVVQPSSRKRKNVISNIMGVTRQNKTQRVIIQVESEEDHPDDGFCWRKYGRKIVTGNANPRSYYRCTYTGCKVRKYVERSQDNVKLVIATYDGMHEHVPPPERIIKSGKKNQTNKDQSGRPQDHINRTPLLGRTPYSSLASQPFPSPLAPQLDMTHYFISGLSMLPILPVNKNHGVMNRDDEPKNDRAIPVRTEVSRG